jgi:enamine deaminase RidA (YjgF/YER057c/UK114 family)
LPGECTKGPDIDRGAKRKGRCCSIRFARIAAEWLAEAQRLCQRHDGRWPHRRGVIGWDAEEKLKPDFVSQVRQALQNISDILAEGGAKPEHLVRLTWYVVDMEEYLGNLKALGQAYREIFGAHYPAMALVQVVRLVELAARVEIEATAVVPR